MDDSRPTAAQVACMTVASTIAWRKFGSSYFDPALHSGRMFDKVDVDGGSREQAARQDSNEFGNLAHRFLPDSSFTFWLPQG